MKEQLYCGLDRIKERLGVGGKILKQLIKDKRIRAFKLNDKSNSPWCCIESEISVDIQGLSKARGGAHSGEGLFSDPLRGR